MDRDGLLHAGVGAKYLLPGNWGARVDARVAFGPSTASGFARDYELLVSLTSTSGGGPGRGRSSVSPRFARPDPGDT